MDRITLEAPAKINLALSVGPPIEVGPHAGYHPIASWMAALDLVDRVTLTRLDGVATANQHTVPSDVRHATHRVVWGDTGAPVSWDVATDLTVRMLDAVRAHTGHPLPVTIDVCKHIPAGGGLGGGSGDAVAVLEGLDRLFGLGLSLAERRTVAMSVGMDCVYFVDDAEHRDLCSADAVSALRPGPAIVTGFGERLERVGHVDATLILIFPDAGCPTGAVYRAYDQRPRVLDEARVRGAHAASVAAGVLADDAVFNDLDGAAEHITPAIGARIALGRQLGRSIHLSGSGSTLWCACGDGDPARMLSQVLNALPVGWHALLAKLA